MSRVERRKRCPKCGLFTVNVYDSRPVKAGRVRGRRCLNCGFRWRTLEIDGATLDRLRRADAQAWREAERIIGAKQERLFARKALTT